MGRRKEFQNFHIYKMLIFILEHLLLSDSLAI